MSASDHESDIVFPEGWRVREARTTLRLSLEKAARAIEMGDGSLLSRIERGTYAPNLERKLQLVRLLSAGGLKLSAIATPAELSLVQETPAA